MDESESFTEEELINRLVRRWHLSVPERRQLPNGHVKGSLIRDAIVRQLQEDGWFPAHWRLEEDFDGGLIERTAEGCRIHWKAEVGVSRYALLVVTPYADVHEAAAAWIQKTWGYDIDGIPIDWTK